MESTYVISWKSTTGFASGQGKKLFTREEAEALAHELNEQHPDFIHQAVNLAPASDTQPEELSPAADASGVIVEFPLAEALAI